MALGQKIVDLHKLKEKVTKERKQAILDYFDVPPEERDLTPAEIGQLLGVSQTCVYLWRSRYRDQN